MKFCALDINEAVKPLNKCEQALEDTIFQKLQEVNNIQLKYIPMEKPAECYRWEETSKQLQMREQGDI